MVLQRRKYPRTEYIDELEDSPFIGREVVITEKMDGENTSMYKDYIHARSIDGINFTHQDWVRCFHAGIKHLIPKEVKICGESMYAVHSISYSNLESYFLGFAVHDENVVWSWDDTIALFGLLDIKSVPVLFEGICGKFTILDTIGALDLNKSEGIVIRDRCEFSLDLFHHYTAKWVRPNHVQTDEHWRHRPIIKNSLIN